MWLKEYTKTAASSRVDIPNENIAFFDKVFDNQIKSLYTSSIRSYDEMRFRDVAKYGFHEFGTIKEEYLINCDTFGPRQDLMLSWIHLQLLLMYPIIPHFTEMAWQLYFLPLTPDASKYAASISNASYPEISAASIDIITIRAYNCLQNFLRNVRITHKKSTTIKKGAKEIIFSKINVIYASKYPEWQQTVNSHTKN